MFRTARPRKGANAARSGPANTAQSDLTVHPSGVSTGQGRPTGSVVKGKWPQY